MIGLHAKISQDFNGARHFLRVAYAKHASQLAPFLLIQTIRDTEQIFGRPKMDVDAFGRPRVRMTEAGGDELYWDAFFVKG